MSDHPGNFILFLGRFHPLLVHLPIGGLILLGILEFFAACTRWKNAAQSGPWILGFVCFGSIMAAACGLMLSTGGGYDPQLLKWHRTAALSMTAGCLLTLLFRLRERRRAYRFTLGITLLLLAVTGHLGGSITHGRHFLTHYAPASLRILMGDRNIPRTNIVPADDLSRRPVFADVIRPILLRRCSTCHGPEKHKGGLRLDTAKGLLKGGNYGPVIKAGDAGDSPLIERLRLPSDDDDHMPPEGKPQPTPEEIEVIEWWINAGATFTKKVGDLEPGKRIQMLLQQMSKRRDAGKEYRQANHP